MRTMMVVVGVVLSLTAQAQEVIRGDQGSVRSEQLREGDEKSRAREDVTELYFSLSDLAIHDQREQMWALSSKSKAALWGYNIQRYLRDHPDLSAEAQEVLREGIRLISTPGWFDIQKGSFGYDAKSRALEEHKQRVKSLLPREVIYDVFIRLGTEPLTFQPERPAPPTIDAGGAASNPSFRSDQLPHFEPRADYDGCHCGSDFDCIFWLACSSSYCDPVVHCGWYGDDLCWGRCKFF